MITELLGGPIVIAAGGHIDFIARITIFCLVLFKVCLSQCNIEGAVHILFLFYQPLQLKSMSFSLIFRFFWSGF